MSESAQPSGAESGPRRWLFWLLVPTLVVLVAFGLRRLQSMRAPYVPQPAPPWKPQREPETASEPESGSAFEPEAETEAEAESGADAEAETGVETDAGAPAPAEPKPAKAERNSKPKAPDPIELVGVPCLVGEPRQRQEEALTDAGLRVGFTLTRLVKGEGGLVVETQPAKDTKVPLGSRVDLVVSVAGGEVGDVIGLSAGAARGRLVRAGFQVKRRRIAAPDGVPVGTVVEQDPRPGTLVPLGSAVTLRVAAESKGDQPELQKESDDAKADDSDAGEAGTES
jgi:eukaryotic-like serine/threonine-protein kinase